jgi:hypothetical protein
METMSVIIRLATIIVLAVVLIAGPGAANASDAGLALLKNEHAARPGAMGAAVSAIGADPAVAVYNPAAAVGLDKFTAAFGHTIFWENIRFESGAFGTRLWTDVYLHGNIRLASVDDLELRDEIPSAEPLGTFSSNDIAGKFGLAYRINDMFSAGFGVGWVFEKIESWRGSAFNIDLGLQAQARPNLRFGASVTGLGGDLVLIKDGSVSSDDIPLPTTWRVGATYQWRMILGAADVVIVDDESHLHLGAEGALHEYLALRAGYMTGYDSKDFTAGAAFTIRDVTVDYAFLPFSNDLGTSHLFTLTFSL